MPAPPPRFMNCLMNTLERSLTVSYMQLPKLNVRKQTRVGVASGDCTSRITLVTALVSLGSSAKSPITWYSTTGLQPPIPLRPRECIELDESYCEYLDRPQYLSRPAFPRRTAHAVYPSPLDVPTSMGYRNGLRLSHTNERVHRQRDECSPAIV